MRRNRNEQIGKLDRRISIEAYVQTLSESGAETLTWEELLKVWSGITYTNNTAGHPERQESNRETAVTNIVFRVRYSKDFLDKKLRIVFEEKQYDIISIVEDGRREFLNLSALLHE